MRIDILTVVPELLEIGDTVRGILFGGDDK